MQARAIENQCFVLAPDQCGANPHNHCRSYGHTLALGPWGETLAAAGDEPAVLQVTLIGYDRTVAVTRADDTGLARRFDVTLRAHATLTGQPGKEVYFAKRPLTATRGVFTDSGLVPAEYETLPLLAEDLANETVHAALDTW